jgi:zinc transport system permease protein
MPEHDGGALASFAANYELFGDAIEAGVAAGAMLGALGVYILLRNLVFLSAALAQVAGLGVALSVWLVAAVPSLLGLWSPLYGAAVMTSLTVLAFARPTDHHDAHQDGVLGVVFLFGAAGTLAVGTRVVAELQDIESLLFGSAVAVLPEDRDTLLAAAAALLVLHAWAWRGFAAVSVDSDGAGVRGLPTRLLDLLLFGSLALGISVVTRILGALPAFALSVLPAMAAVRLGRSLRSSLVVAALVGGLAAALGYLAAFLWELPVGAAQTLVCLACLAVAELTHRIGERHGHRH